MSDVLSFDSSMFVACMLARDRDAYISNDSELSSKVEDNSVLTSLPEPQDVIKEDVEPVLNNEPSSSSDTLIWKEEDCDAPNSTFSLHSRIIAHVASIVKDEFALILGSFVLGLCYVSLE